MRLAERLRGSVRAKLLALVLAPLMLGFPLIMGVLWYWGEVYYHRLMVSRVASDLATAHGYFERVIDGVGNGVQGLAGSHALAQTLAHESPEAVAALLGARKGGLALDFLNLLDVNGRVLHASTALAAGSARGGWPVVQQAIRARGGSVVERFAPAELAAIDAGMRERARLALVATARARPDSRGEEERGLVVHAAAPVLDAAGNLVAVLEGGVLLNGNLDFVDTLNAIVYREGSLPEGSVLGVVTGKKYELYAVDSLGEEVIETPAGRFRTLHLRAMTDNVTEIWIALDRERLPVKIRFTDKKGESFEQVATDIE